MLTIEPEPIIYNYRPVISRDAIRKFMTDHFKEDPKDHEVYFWLDGRTCTCVRHFFGATLEQVLTKEIIPSAEIFEFRIKGIEVKPC